MPRPRINTPLALALLVGLATSLATVAAPAGHHQPIAALSISPDGRQLASGAADGSIMLWDAADGTQQAVLAHHRLVLDDLAFTPNGAGLLGASWDGTVSVWDLASRTRRLTLAGHDGPVHAVAVSPDGTHAATAGLDRRICLWDLADGQKLAEHSLPAGGPVPNSLAFDTDGSRLAIGTRVNTAYIWSVADWQPLAEVETGMRAETVRFAADGRLVVGGAGVEFRDPATGQRLDTLEADRLQGPFALSADGSHLAVLTRQGVRIRHADTWTDEQRLDREAGRPGAVAISPDGRLVAVGGATGRIDILDTTDHARRAAIMGISPHAVAVIPSPPAGAPESLTGFNLLAAADGREAWHRHDASGALAWTDTPDGLRFAAKATPVHHHGEDHLVLATALGTRPFELAFDTRIDTCAGHNLFHSGLAVGVASAPLGHAGTDDVAAAISIHFAGLYAGVRRGEPYALIHGGSNVSTDSLTALTDNTPVPAIPWTDDLRALIATDRPLKATIRRDGLNVLHFSMWAPDLGQTRDAPWWSGSWPMPDDIADTPLNYVFIKRVPIPSVHLGAQATGYDDIMLLDGTLESMTLHLDPPAIAGVEWEGPVLEPGRQVTVTGAGFGDGARVLIGDRPAAAVDRRDTDNLRVTLPDALSAGERYDLHVVNADGLATRYIGALPIGRRVESASLAVALPAGGDTLTVHGSGFEAGTRVFAGDRETETVAVHDRADISVRLPPGAHGPARLTARTADGEAFAGSVPFAYAGRPRLWFDAAERDAWRERSTHPTLAAYRDRIIATAERSFGDLTLRHAGPGGRPAALAWAWTLTGDDRYASGAVAWLRLILDEDSHDNWRDHDRIVASVLDLAGDTMDTDLRARAQHYLMATLDRWLAEEADDDWMITSINSTNPSVNVVALMAALLLEDAYPHSETVIRKASGHMRRYLAESYAPRGGTRESLFWGLQGLGRYLEAAHLLARHRDDRSLLDHPRLAQVPRMFPVIIAQPKRLFAFNDSHLLPEWIVSTAAALGTLHDDTLLQWVADDTLARASGEQAALAMLWRGGWDFPAEAPAIPVVDALPAVEWGVMRNRPAPDAELAVGLKGLDGPMSYRYHYDIGSFALLGHGETLLVEAGWGGRGADRHSIPIIDGVASDATGGTITDTLATGPWRALSIDLTEAYGPHGIAHVHRTLLMHGDEHLIVLDDIDPGATRPGEVISQWQTRSRAHTLNEATVTLEHATAALTARFFGPEVTVTARRRGDREGADWHTVETRYTAAGETPLVTVMRVVPGDEPAPVDSDVSYTDDRITVTLPGGDRAIFRRTDSGWGLIRPDGDGETVLRSPRPPFTRPVVHAVRAHEPPVLDGQLDDPIWQRAVPAVGFTVADRWDTDRAARYPTEARFAWDDEHLYIAIRCFEPELDSLHTRITGPAQDTSSEDYIVFYLDPDAARTSQPFYGRRITAAGNPLGRYGASGDLGRA